jgi:hypothetical protein
MAKSSYNSVGAGETPKLGACKSVYVKSRPGGSGRSFDGVTVTADLPKVARPSGYGKDMGSAPGEAPKAARPGGYGKDMGPVPGGAQKI